MPLAYPASLPSPTMAPLQPSERRILTSLPGPRGARGIQRDWHGTQRVEFVFSQAQAEVLRDWWRDDLVLGGAWFAADWPVPSGWTAAAVRRFIAQPAWQVIPGYGWRVSAECEVRGRGELPQAPVSDPYFGDVVLLAHMDEDYADSSRYMASPSIAGVATISSAQSRWGAGSGTTGGAIGANVAYTGAQLDLSTGDFTVEYWRWRVSGGPNINVCGQARTGDAAWRIGEYIADAPEPAYHFVGWDGSTPIVSLTQDIGITPAPSNGEWTHLAVTREGDTFRLFISGVLHDEGVHAGALSVDPGGPGVRLFQGIIPVPTRSTNDFLNDLRITKRCRYDATFGVPQAAFPDR